MRLSGGRDGSTGWSSLIVAGTLVIHTLAKTEAPRLTYTSFDNLPRNPEYFDDSDVILMQDWVEDTVYRSENAGEKWEKIDKFGKEGAWTTYMHPFDKKRAYVLTREMTHWRTEDRGATWSKFFADAPPSLWRDPLNFHAGDPDRIIFNGQACAGLFCEEVSMYTTDGFRTDAKALRDKTAGCHWAKSTVLFTTGEESKDLQRILCIAKGKFSPWPEDYRLLISDNYFTATAEDDGEYEPNLEPGQGVRGIVNMAVVKKYLVAAASSRKTDEMALYVTDDTIQWHRAIIPHDHKLKEDAYTLLESTSYSIQLDVMSNSLSSNPMGVLLNSNSNGTYFTRNIEHTNRNSNGYVDFEKMTGIQGIVFVNTVSNWEEVQNTVDAKKKVQSSVSFDDGRTWEYLTAKNERLHLHEITDISNIGKVLSSAAPGLVMAVGNTGKHLKSKKDGNLYVSDDAGRTWEMALKGPHKYEFGDQGSILVAISPEPTDVINYSLNHGKTWTSVDLPVKQFEVQLLTTTLDSTSLKFLLTGGTGEMGDKYEKNYVITIDFSEMHERRCGKEDLEKWYARVGDDGNPTCLMGHKQYYNRRLKDAECFLMQEFDDPEVQSEICPCAKQDFECDFNFVMEDGECIKSGDLVLPEGACKAFDDETEFDASSGYRLIPGNDCNRAQGKQLDDPIRRKCSEAIGNPPSPADGKVANTQQTFAGDRFTEKYYLERTEKSSGVDESIVAKTDQGLIYLSKDHGKTWTEILKDIKIDRIIPNPYFNDMICFVTADGDVYYSTDRGDNIRQFGSRPNSYPDKFPSPLMDFHPKNKDWIIWVGVKDKQCVTNNGGERDCHAEASLTKDRGDHWETMLRYVRKCEFVPGVEGQRRNKQLIYCDVRKNESPSNDNNPWQLVSSEDLFKTRTTHFPDIIGFATMSEFIVVARKDDDTSMKAAASVDGSTFAEALFPSNFKVPPKQSGYTALDSSTHAVFLLVTVEPDSNYKYGSLIKSNSNGTSYVLSLNAVNQDSNGYVDFEKARGVEGVALANVLANPETVKKDGVKFLKTMITHNDGADWNYLTPPEKDVNGKAFDCQSNLETCSMHIHGYTERKYRSHTQSSPTAVGIMIGIGNVGEHLGPKTDADTFISTDAGITWREAMKGPYMWEFGDQGSIIVLVNTMKKTKVIYYSLDEGTTWVEYEFADEEVDIDEITTLPSDNSRNFVLWAKTSDGLATINIDFSGITDHICELDDDDPEGGDYYLWTPSHPEQDDDCLFGHISQYHRKKTAAQCYNGRILDRLHNVESSCLCDRRDFECDYNYERRLDGTCVLHLGAVPMTHLTECAANPDQVEYYEPSGYRRIPLTTCNGGRELDRKGAPQPCPGKEKEFSRKYGASRFGVFLAVVIPIAIAIGAGWWVWRNWEGKFGQIRLGESTFDDQAPYIKYPVLAISAIVAVIITLPSLISSAWRGVSSLLGRSKPARFTTRSSFARGADYAPVDEDEGELLGDDSDEEV